MSSRTLLTLNTKQLKGMMTNKLLRELGEKKKGKQNPAVNRHCITLMWLPKQYLQEPEVTIPHLCLTGLLFSTLQSPKDVLCILTADPPAISMA